MQTRSVSELLRSAGHIVACLCLLLCALHSPICSGLKSPSSPHLPPK